MFSFIYLLGRLVGKSLSTVVEMELKMSCCGLKRSRKSCRLQWTNYLRPDLKHDRFTPQEEDLMVSLQNLPSTQRTRIDYRQYELSDSETESRKIDKSARIHSDDGSNNNRPPLEDDSMGSEEDETKNFNEPIILKPRESMSETQENEPIRSPTSQEVGNSRKGWFLD
ncbi:hypothetical protein AMTRI_Chr03g46660 [Amborella trichopoda]